MINAPHYSAAGVKRRTEFALPVELFDGLVNEDVLHQAVKSFLGNQRQGTSKVKTRAEVSGGGRKPLKQKGTGRARQGSNRAPHWRGGGVAFGPSPRSYRTDLPKKVRQLARRSALNARAREGMLHVIESIALEAPKTQVLLAMLEKLSLGGVKTLILTDGGKSAVYLSARNVPHLSVLPFADASAWDILRADALVIEDAALGDEAVAGAAGAADSAPAAKKPAARKAATKEAGAAKAAPRKAAAKKAAPKKESE